MNFTQTLLRVEPSTIIFPPTYISNTNHLAVKIINEENEIIQGEWRKFPSYDEEQKYIQSLDINDPKIRSDLWEAFLYKSDIFQIGPISSEIWPSRYQQFIISFTPKEPGNFCETAYFTELDPAKDEKININNNQQFLRRIPLTIKGTGMPPMAKFNVNQINVGHVMLDSFFEYRVKLENIGHVDLNFHLDCQPQSRATSSRSYSRRGTNINDSSNSIIFTPESGSIPANNSLPITIQLNANHVGQLNELFTFTIDGTDSYKPQILITGKVLGPSFKIDKHNIDFSVVSFGFLYTESFEITNESQIPFDFNFHLANDGTFEFREFNVVPSSCTVPKFGTQKVCIEFIPIRIQDYNVNLIIDAPKFDDILFTMPISATCIVPEITVKKGEISLGEIFIGHRFRSFVSLADETNYPAKYEFIDPNDSSSLEATIEFLKPRGIIPANQSEECPFVITPHQLGPMKFVRYVRIYGSENPSIPFTITAFCRGPNILLSTTDVSFGQINVLEDVTKEITVFNDSLIESHFVATFANDNKAFDVFPVESDILAGQKLTLRITANLNDVGFFRGRLILSFLHIAPMTVELKAKGFGSTLVPSIDMEKIDFGYVFIGQKAICHFSLENRGRRSQEVRWSFPKPKNDESTTVMKSIEPDQITINKGEIAHFELTIESPIAETFSFNLLCHCILNRQRSEVFNPQVIGTFIKPLIEFQLKNMTFKYVHDVLREEEISGNISSSSFVSPSKSLLMPIIQQNQIKNLSLLPLTISTVCPNHFSISPSEFTIQPQETEFLEVTFDPSYKTTFASETFDTHIRFNFQDSPHFYNLKIHSEFVFPNLSFEPSTSIDFGILMTNAEDSRQIRAINTSPVSASFYWELLPQKDSSENSLNSDEIRIFDIYPIRGNVDPGESIEMHVSFFASEGNKVNGSAHFSSVAICHVIGGPEYAINLTGQSASIHYSLSTKSIDFGQADYSSHLHETFSLDNKSEVPISFKVKIPKNCGFKSIHVSPKEGSVEAGETIHFSLNLICGIPKSFKTSFLIEISHFVDEQIDLSADCYYPQLHFSDLKRDEDDPTTEFIKKKETTIQNEINFDEEEKNLLIERSTNQKKILNSSSLVRPISKLSSIRRFDGFVLSSFVVDFEEIILGETRSIDFELSSLTPFPICFEILAQSLNGTGFSISPTSFLDIPPNENLKVTITFDTMKRTIEKLGVCDYQIPIVIKEDLGYILTIKVTLKMPTLTFSKTAFEFEPTIAGQTRIQTFQIQNQNEVPCEFKFECSKKTNVFIMNPSNVVLPPSSFVNVDISFSPVAAKEYVMQFPVRIKHNDDVFNISVKGKGIQMKLIFEPSSINFNSIEEFSEPSKMSVDVINNENYPIDIFSPQFDHELLLRTLRNIDKMNSNFESNENLRSSVSFSNLNHKNDHAFINQPKINKISVCIIVNGPPKSGKTTVSRAISKHMNGIPIISLAEVWQTLLTTTTATSDDYISTLHDFISQKEYQKGFVIDGLDVFPENNESESFLIHFLKQKSTQEELQKNPFTVLQHANSTSNEISLSYILEALDGHYVYHIALNENEAILAQRQSSKNTDESSLKMQKNREEVSKLFNMTEDEYQQLSDEQQQIVDKKRDYLRKYIMLHGDDLSNVNLDGNLQIEKEKAEKTKKQKQTKSTVPTDPFLFSVMLFQYTFGRMCEKVSSKSNFILNDFYINKSSSVATSNTTAKTTASGNRGKNSNKTQKDKNKELLNEFSISSNGNLLVDASLPIDSVLNEIFGFLPDLSSLKEKSLSQSLQQPRLVLPKDSVVGSLTLQKMPDFFRIVNDHLSTQFEIPEDLINAYQIYLKQESGNNIHVSESVSNDNLEEEEYYFDYDLKNYTKRWHIESNSRITLNLEFNAEIIGNYSSNLLFGICNCRNEIFKLPVAGEVIRPDIDRNPKIIFGNVSNGPSSKATFSYIQSTGEFQFGSLLLSKDKLNRNNSAIYKQDLTIVNTSAFSVNVNAFLHESGTKTVWTIENNSLEIDPNEKATVTIGFNPISVELYRNTLSILVKDNPEPLIFPITGEGCSPNIEISSTNIDFEKLLLNQERTMKLELTNKGKIGAFWRIKGGSNALGNNLTISSTEGQLKPSKTSSIEFTFGSPKPVIVKKSIQIDILDQNQSKVFMSHHVNLQAEAFDVSFELCFPKSLTHLMFGSVKVGQSKYLCCTLRNHGRYPAKYKLAVNGKSKVSSLIKVDPAEGTIPAGEKGVSLNFTFNSNKPLKLSNSRGINLHVFDSNTGTNEETAVIPIPVSVESVYSKFSFEPENDTIQFGIVQLNTNLTRELKIMNNGSFPFEFEIVPKLEITPPDFMSEIGSSGRNRFNGRAKNQKKTSQTVGKQKKSNGKEFPIGPFVVSTSAGKVEPNSSVTVPIHLNSGNDGQFENQVVVKVSDTDPNSDDFEGRPFKLLGSCVVPGLLASDYEKIFPGQHLCLRYDLKKIETMAFLEDEQIFHFTPLLVNQKNSVEVALINANPISCAVDLSLKPKSSTASHFPFDLSDKFVTIEGNSKFTITVTFSPLECGPFYGLFEAVVKGGTNPKTKSIKFGVEGVGALPSVTLQPPSEMTSTRSTIINFGKTLVDFKKEKTIGILNDGVIPATVTIKATQKDDDFQLNLFEKDSKSVCTLTKTIKTNSNLINSSKRRTTRKSRSKDKEADVVNNICHEFLLLPGKQQTLHVCYSPLLTRKGQFHITIEVKDNSQKDISLTFIGEGYSEDVIFESLVGDEDNDIIFRDNVVGQKQQLSFMMHNVSSNNVRFAWFNSSDFTFSPRVGHLKCHSKKEVTVTFLTEKPVTYNSFSASCQWSKIEYQESDPPEWDDSMQQVSFVQRNMLIPGGYGQFTEANTRATSTKSNLTEVGKLQRTKRQTATNRNKNSTKNGLAETSVVFVSSKGPEFDLIKVVEIKPEPLFEVIPGRRKDLVLKISAVSDTIKYEIDTSEIEFATTMMFETRVSYVKIKNVSKIRFEYKWNTSLFGSLRTDYAQMMKSPFSVEPSSGFIEPDELATFQIMFSPKEVDDFTSHVICEIPQLTNSQKQPEIYVTGRSRRPICHLDLETSDYLSAGRRHPDYTDNLPENVKVMEILSKGIGEKSIKQFQIINTTGAPYEIVWSKIPSLNSGNTDEDPISCITQRVVISSGRRHNTAFIYVPNSVKTVESLWEFRIPEHGVTIPLLVVGRIIPH